ncbi:hypothetical protein LIER_36559 [Lithospermum erythrorhizon]|uniref:Uncharacterized protein n=1 Tax=Lithospermum erythrorhizon TaxID=34254 RepID=A0AAV3P850_LITER
MPCPQTLNLTARGHTHQYDQGRPRGWMDQDEDDDINPRSMFKAASLALDFEAKICQARNQTAFQNPPPQHYSTQAPIPYNNSSPNIISATTPTSMTPTNYSQFQHAAIVKIMSSMQTCILLHGMSDNTNNALLEMAEEEGHLYEQVQFANGTAVVPYVPP